MVHDLARAVPQPAPQPAVHDIAHPARRPVHTFHVGWILSTGVAAAAAWAVGWVAGVTWAWREMTSWHWSRTHRRRGTGRLGGVSPLRS